MIDFDQASALIAGLAIPLGREPVCLDQARGRILAAPIVASASAPPQDVSAMDGYAVCDADLERLPARLAVAGESFAGRGYGGQLAPGACVRIFTGAPVPPGACRVVMQEDVSREGDWAVFGDPPGPRRHLRRAGSDFQAGDVLVPPGVRLNAQRLLAAAAADLAEVEVHVRPRLVLLATGDELAAPGAPPAGGETIPESVSFGVGALVEDWGGQVVARRRCGDDLEKLTAAAAWAVGAADVVVVTGGASVGEKDFAQAMFAPLGLELVFAKVAMRPGKPVWVGRAGGAIVVGLPGNPTSAMVTARLFLAPLLAGLGGGRPGDALAWRTSPLAAPLPGCDARETFYRAQLTPGGIAIVDDQDSSAQRALAASDALVRRRPGEGWSPAAEPVSYLPL